MPQDGTEVPKPCHELVGANVKNEALVLLSRFDDWEVLGSGRKGPSTRDGGAGVPREISASERR